MSATAAIAVEPRQKSYDTPEITNLVHRAKTGDETAFRKLHDIHRGHVIVTITRFIGDVDTAEWIANIALTKVWTHLSSFKEESKFSTWVTRIAINEARMHLRTENRHNKREVPLEDLLKPGKSGQIEMSPMDSKYIATHDLNLEGTADRDVLAQAITRVPVQFREILRLRFWEGLDLDEIQEHINKAEQEPVSISAVKSRILRGKTMLIRVIEELS